MATEQGSDRAERSPGAAGRPAEKGPVPVTIERVTHQEVPAICALYKKVVDSHPSDLPIELLKGWQPTPLEFTSWMEGVTYFVARRESRLVGSVGCEIRHGACHLVNLVVDPEFRRQGVASALIGTAIEWARKSNAAVVWLDPLARLTPTVALLQHLGFSEAGVLHKHMWAEDVRVFERTV
ncbi:MAG TPA: GNAT family N-acetyltransferase [Thermoplasmata archaeon]|nr:GNAT family N-acetyltransferase [Thermoplasmata archaeon]